ncbi:MAG TPA: hypothetical protein VN851_22520 [Thermoanaerobaculia bacterium]|nr:hypothetical protein [Thermoanaerobaculia bacterium]
MQILPIVHDPEIAADLPRGFCKYWDGLLIKANGRIPCGSDHGEGYTIVDADLETVDFVPEVFNGPAFRQMRLRTAVEHRAFMKQCARCAAFKPFEVNFDNTERNPHYPSMTSLDADAERQLARVQSERGWPLGSIDWVGNLHLEPSLPCTLRCPACLQGYDPGLLRREGPPYYFSLSVLQNIMRSFQRHDVTVQRIGFGGRGEPTLSQSFPELIRCCRTACPGALLEADTNCQHPFKDEFLMLDAMYCSIDGSTQESYETYRIGRSFEKCVTFLKAATERKRALQSNCKITWKYILFDTTESVELLNRAQNLALELGVDALLFVITWTAGTNGKVFPPKVMTTLPDVQAYLDAHPIFPASGVKHQ